MKKRFDVAVVVPLDEEFETALSYFQYVADLSTSQSPSGDFRPDCIVF